MIHHVDKGLRPLLILFALFIGITSIAYSQVPQSERQALIDLYKSTNGANWLEEKAWDMKTLETGDLSKLPNVYLTKDKQHIGEIVIIAANMTGTLPANFFARLPKLQIFNISQNKIGGSIPVDLSGAVELHTLQLGSNQFGGKIPDLSKLTKLKVLTLEFMTKLDAQPLPAFTKAKGLEVFDAWGSNFTGTVPPSIGDLPGLRFFDVSMNKLSGVLPAELNKCTRLNILSVMDNKLSGEIPDLSALVNLGSPSTGETGRLYLSQNQFTGAFPAWVVGCTKLDRFSVSNNKLSGSLPEDFSGMTSLKAFFVDGNQFTGSLPKLFASSIEDLNFTLNRFEGAIPAEWAKLPNLWKILVSFNQLSGYAAPVYLDQKGKPKADFETIEAYQNLFSFADFRDWVVFAKDKDANFRFSLQRPYTEKIRKDVARGGQIILDATYPGSTIGDERYQWFDLNTAQAVEKGNKAQLTITNATKDHAHRYICFVTTKAFGTDYSTALFEQASPSLALTNCYDSMAPQAIESLSSPQSSTSSLKDLPPTLQSGFFDLYVDGQTIASVEAMDAKPSDHWLYPSVIKLGGTVQIEEAELVEVIRFFTPDGRLAYEATRAEIRQNAGRMTPPLPIGLYIVLGIKQGGHILPAKLLVSSH